MESTNDQKNKTNNFLISLLSILLLISVFIAGFFAYQTQQLVKELRVMSNQSKSTPIPTQTPDPTADWKTYTFTKLGFEFKLPENWTIVSSQDISKADVDLKVENNSNPQGQYYMEEVISGPSFYLGPKNILDNYQLPNNSQEMANLTSVINGYFAYSGFISGKESQFMLGQKEATITQTDTSKEIFVPMTNPKIKKFGLVLSVETKDNFEILDQILSTFKFVELVASSSPLPVACTMESKICPDGSAIGRGGPRCEFPPCPTTKPATSPLP